MAEEAARKKRAEEERLKKERFLLADALKQIQLILKANASRFEAGIQLDALVLAEKVFFTDYD